ncbi:hypothetical protein [Ramlibacter humi]|uniref:Uncharacterized protein n=1 Tax=Ramlibacter humi TaxID=2530451 RepID=A0A4Z0BD96_9BURK|nr:hypothetical protein [Ramlibacter humi]TFY96359.1 hypothetical protein EZ216_20705 [Ramlibacter humi]
MDALLTAPLGTSKKAVPPALGNAYVYTLSPNERENSDAVFLDCDLVLVFRTVGALRATRFERAFI